MKTPKEIAHEVYGAPDGLLTRAEWELRNLITAYGDQRAAEARQAQDVQPTPEERPMNDDAPYVPGYLVDAARSRGIGIDDGLLRLIARYGSECAKRGRTSPPAAPEDAIQVITRALCLSTYERCEEMTRPFAESVVKALEAADFEIVPRGELQTLRSERRTLMRMLREFTTDA